MPGGAFDVRGRVALVTGASGGLGRSFALALAREGAVVVAAARRADALEALVAEIAAAGGEAQAVRMDVTDPASVRDGFAHAEAGAGTPRIVVNNSGVAVTASVMDLEVEDWDRVVDTNLKGAWLVAREAARRMVAASVAGTIINIASLTAFRVVPGLGAYAATKAGLVQLTRTMALEVARHGIRVNAIAPGYILTDMNREFFESEPGLAMIKRIPQRRIGRPEHLEGALLLLASDASEYMTGSVVTVDGGHLQSSL